MGTSDASALPNKRCCSIRFAPGWIAAALLAAATTPSGRPADLAQYARPLCGTGEAAAQEGDNNTFPGAVVPFGMIQWSPDTSDGRHRGGYYDRDTTISDFSVDHVSGAGCPYGEDFALMPILGPAPAAPPSRRDAFAQPFSHADESAQPGCYEVRLGDGIEVGLATTVRTGFGRLVYPGGALATLMVNAASDINGSLFASIRVDPAAREVSGWSVGGRFCRKPNTRTIYFDAAFDRPFRAWSVWSGDRLTAGATSGEGRAAGAYLTFDVAGGRTVFVKVAISYVSVANARANLAAENSVSAFSPEDFVRAAAASRAAWNARLGRIEVQGGTHTERVTFYSMLYHALIGPTVVSDANGQYTGYDGRVHTAAPGRAQYGLFSGWDIYRSECQLLAMVAPKEAGDMAESLLEDYRQGGAFPRWGAIAQDSGVMMGDPAAAMIADFYAFGARGFETRAALAGLVRAATDPSVAAPRSGTRERDALAEELRLGYVPEHQQGGYGSVSMTLEYASADFALSRLALGLGDRADAQLLLRHAGFWRNLYNPRTGYLQMRRRDGSWAPGFADNLIRYDGDTAYVEGTAGQYVWMVPFDLGGLARLMGGREVALRRLDHFFTRLDTGSRGPDAALAWLGNEPNLNAPWIYDFLGRPWRTQAVVRRAMAELYSDGDAAYPGNDDVGEMSSWYLFGALGFYPELPGSGILLLGSPLFPRAVVHLAGGNLTITGAGAAAGSPYVQSLRANGRTWDKPWIRYADVAQGGELAFRIGPAPNPRWGSAPEDAPPSYPPP